jgi:hypothetical protein
LPEHEGGEQQAQRDDNDSSTFHCWAYFLAGLRGCFGARTVSSGNVGGDTALPAVQSISHARRMADSDRPSRLARFSASACIAVLTRKATV